MARSYSLTYALPLLTVITLALASCSAGPGKPRTSTSANLKEPKNALEFIDHIASPRGRTVGGTTETVAITLPYEKVKPYILKRGLECLNVSFLLHNPPVEMGTRYSKWNAKSETLGPNRSTLNLYYNAPFGVNRNLAPWEGYMYLVAELEPASQSSTLIKLHYYSTQKLEPVIQAIHQWSNLIEEPCPVFRDGEPQYR